MIRLFFLILIVMFSAISCSGLSGTLKEIDGMVYVPSGNFIMGSSLSDLGKNMAVSRDELPQRKVFIEDFYIDRYETTIGEFTQFIEATGNRPPLIWLLKDYNYPLLDDSHPVHDLSASSATAYCKWRGKRLPTEAEWEKAARGTDGRLYPWGNDWNEENCNTASYSERMWTVPVGSKKSDLSPYGVYGMCGNVAEYTSSWYEIYKGNKLKISPVFKRMYRVFRGAPYSPESIHIARRGKMEELLDNYFVGVRCAK